MLLRQLCALAPQRSNVPCITKMFYHGKPKDRAKLSALRAAKEAEKKAAFKKYEPFPELTPLDDVLTVLRQRKVSVDQAAVAGGQSGSELTCRIMSDQESSPFRQPQKKCIICEHNIQLDYKNVRLLSQFVSPFTGRIYGAAVTGLCVPMQRRVASLIKRARLLGLIPVIQKDVRFLKDPPLFNPFRSRH